MKFTITKIFALVMAAVMLTAVLSACEFSIGNTDKDNGGLGDITVNGSTAPGTSDAPDTPTSGDTTAPTTQAPSSDKPTDPPSTTKPPETTQKPTGNIDPKFIGIWGYHGNGVFAPMSDNEWIEFKADGTFIYFNKTASTAFDGFKDNTFVGWEGSFVQSGARSLTIKGKYSIQSGSIKCTDMSATLESLYSNETFPDEYKNKPMDNTSWPYKFSKGITGGSGAYDALEFLEIDMFGGGYKGFIIPIDLNAIKGVVNYPSALPNSISPTEINCIFTSASGEKDAWQHRFEATFACSSETEMKTKAGAYFARLEAMGFDKGYLYDYRQGLDVEGKISGKTYKITCSYISFAKQAVLYFDILN